MMSWMDRVRLMAGVLVVVALADGCVSMKPLSSFQRSSTIIVDGMNQEWLDVPAYSAKGRFMLSIVNDSENLYLCLSTRDQQTQMQMMMGATFWFDPNGGTERTFGIKYPVGPLSGGVPPAMEKTLGVDLKRGEIQEFSNEIEVLGAEERDRTRVPLDNSSDIQARIGKTDGGTVCYELKIPLRRTQSHPLAIGAGGSQHIGLGILLGSPQPAMGENREGPGRSPEGSGDGGRPLGVGMPSREGGPPGGGGMRGGQGSPPAVTSAESLDMWFALALSVAR